jgi:hypothetical protein
MGNTWITDIRHFLREDGSIPDLPGPAARLAEYIGSIIGEVTSCHPDDCDEVTNIRCRRRPGRKRCTGKIIAYFDEEDSKTIRWFCPICNDNGYISGWQGTIWDRSN